MPVVQPQTWDKAYNPWLFNKAEEFWNKIPADVRSELKFMSDAPTPGLPIGAADDIVAGGMKGAVAIPAMLANPKTRTYLKNMMGGLDLGEAIKAVRNQQENFPFAFTQWIKDRIPRSALFFSPGGHKFGYDEMAEGAAEGGPHRVEWLQKLKNPLVIKRDETGFLAEHVLRTLLGSESVKQGNKYVSVPNEEGRKVLESINRVTSHYPFSTTQIPPKGSATQQAYDTVAKYIEPKQLESSLSARDPKTALGEAIASELARKAGYDSIISTRPKAVVSASQKMANEATLSRLHEYADKVVEQHRMLGQDPDSPRQVMKAFIGEPNLAKRTTVARLNKKIQKRTELNSEQIREIMSQKLANYPLPTKREAEAFIDNAYDSIMKKVAKRGAKTELLPTQVMLIDKPWLKEMRQKGKDFLQTPEGGQLPFNPATMSQKAKDIQTTFTNSYYNPNDIQAIIAFNKAAGNLTGAEANYLKQTLLGAFKQ